MSENGRREFGTVYKRGRIWWVRYSVGGRTYYESSGSTSKREAEKLLDRRQMELGLGKFVAPDVKRTTFEDLAAIIRDDYRVNRRRSTERLETSLKHLESFFAGTKALAITTDRIKAHIRERQEEGAAPASIQKELAALRRMFNLAQEAGKVAQTPKLPTLRVSNVRQGFFEEADLRALLDELPEHLRPVVEFAYLTGWRIQSEVLSLTWRQVDFEGGTVRLEPGTTKNEEGREFPFGVLARLKGLLQEQRARTTVIEKRIGRIIPWVFHRQGRRIKDFRGAWAAARERAATQKAEGRRVIVRPQLLERIPHDLRRTAIRNLERAGVPRSVAMKLTGHKTESVYRRYAIVAPADLREGVEKLARLHRETERRIAAESR